MLIAVSLLLIPQPFLEGLVPLAPAKAPSLTAPAALQEPDLKELLDFQLSTLRLSQKSNGSYGSGVADTAHALLAFSLGPRAYRSEDGPFIKTAVQFILDQGLKTDSTRTLDLLVAAALTASDRNSHADAINSLLAKHKLKAETWNFATAVPGWTDSQSIAHLMAIPQSATISQRALGCARGVLAYRKEQEVHKGQLKAPEMEKIYESGIDFLVGEIGKSGMWEFFGQPEPGISALAAKALLGSSRPEIRALAEPILDQLRVLQKEDGSIHGGRLPVYVTSVAIGALAAGGRAEDQKAMELAANYLRAVQADGDEGYSESDKFYGGIGYGGDLRPDLSNLQYALQALKDSGADEDDPAFQRALKFLERSQNLREVNKATYTNGEDDQKVKSGDDGGGVYYPGNSQAGYEPQPDGTVIARSYGSMTYALLKCYAFAGLDSSDPRLAAALKWVERHWSLEVNPGFDSLRDPRASLQGLYYYYLSLAQALQVAGVDQLNTPDGRTHDWRAELQNKLANLQRKDGSWLNEDAPRWWEGNSVLCTAYALDALLATQDAMSSETSK